VRRTTVEITVLVLTNHLLNLITAAYCLLLTIYSISSNEIVYSLDYLNHKILFLIRANDAYIVDKIYTL